jgi:hypothetical protein
MIVDCYVASSGLNNPMQRSDLSEANAATTHALRLTCNAAGNHARNIIHEHARHEAICVGSWLGVVKTEFQLFFRSDLLFSNEQRPNHVNWLWKPSALQMLS